MNIQALKSNVEVFAKQSANKVKTGVRTIKAQIPDTVEFIKNSEKGNILSSVIGNVKGAAFKVGKGLKYALYRIGEVCLYLKETAAEFIKNFRIPKPPVV